MKSQTKGTDITIQVNNFTLSYDDLGQGTNTIIFLHGFPFSKDMWEGQMAHLKDSNRVIACDIRGFGKSKDENSALSIDLFAEDLIQFMDKLAINKAVICGLSMGGFIALNAQIKYPDPLMQLFFVILNVCLIALKRNKCDMKQLKQFNKMVPLNSTKNLLKVFSILIHSDQEWKSLKR